METPSDLYVRLGFTREELAAEMRSAWDDLIEFVTSPAFRAAHQEMMSLPSSRRPGFTARVFLNPGELTRRGIHTPDEVLVQTSAFGDRRPTLFVVKKYLSPRFHQAWENVNITFDDEYPDTEVSRDPEVAWRRPLPVALQNAALAGGVGLETLPDIYQPEA